MLNRRIPRSGMRPKNSSSSGSAQSSMSSPPASLNQEELTLCPLSSSSPSLLLERERAAGRVDDPASLTRQVSSPPRSPERSSPVLVARQLDVLDAGAAEEVDPGFEVLLAEEVLEAAAVELVARVVERAVDAPLDPLAEVAIAVRREPPAQPELVQLVVSRDGREGREPRRSSARETSTVDSPTLKAASGAGPTRFSAMKTLVSGRRCLSCSPSVSPARPPPRIATS